MSWRGCSTGGTILNPDRDALGGFGLSLLVKLVILAVSKFGKGFVVNISVLIGIVVGAIVAAVLGRMHFDAVGSAPGLWTDHAISIRTA